MGLSCTCREGYEEGLSTSHKPVSAVEFLLSDAPVELLGRATKFELEGPRSEQVSGGDQEAGSISSKGLDLPALAAAVREAVGKDPEIKALCGDLQVRGCNSLTSPLCLQIMITCMVSDFEIPSIPWLELSTCIHSASGQHEAHKHACSKCSGGV
jgi:hypothetical protein